MVNSIVFCAVLPLLCLYLFLACDMNVGRRESWKKGTNWCLWDGITCDAETGNVIELDLSCSCLLGPISSNTTLFLLRHLRHLKLDNNDFRMSALAATTFRNLRYLEVLDLSFSNFRGPIPADLGNLTRLNYLDLSNNNLVGLIPFSVFNLTQLEHLDFSHNNLVGSLPPRVSGLSRLSILQLDGNSLSGRVPSWLFSLLSLVELRLANNKLTGPIPGGVAQLVNLSYLDLSFNKLSGSFDLDKLSKLSQLEELSLSNNPLLSLISASNANYSWPSIRTLSISFCNLSEFPNFVTNLEGLLHLNLSYNKISVIEANMFVKLKNLVTLDLSHNTPLSLTNNHNLTLVFPSLDSLSLSSCKITEFSNFLTMQQSLTVLDLSNNSIQGRITKQENIWGSHLQNLLSLDLSNNLLTAVEYYPWENIETLNLGSNRLEGPLLVPPISTQQFAISNNRLSGEIPSSICSIGFDSNVLDLSYNNMSGAIPNCLGFAKLSVLHLQMNHFHGNIPDFCDDDDSLRSLSLNNNDFDGPLPKSLANCESLEVLNLGNNKINDTFPHWLGTLPQLQVLVLRSNYFLQRTELITRLCESWTSLIITSLGFFHQHTLKVSKV
ncbi:receptor like protein 33 [Hibiscus trionum]|uniref:Receptor like protein 33 n=1 Tax=Hibiscus trionum TaxID=183268 RepID=A0A9W7J8A8_HIBTR|nr:receptor like protein 33 [Hibiscus trionum]